MADKDKLRDMIDSMIDDNSEKAEVDFHGYVTGKMQDVLDINPADEEEEIDDVEIEVDED
jgi:hypothetical protein